MDKKEKHGEAKESKNNDKDIKMDDKERKIQDLTETLQRLQADFENYRKRTELECLANLRYGKNDLVKKLLPVLDSFELALKNTDNVERFKKGVELIFAQLYDALENEGLKPIDALGKPFDPYKHEAMLKEKSEKDEDIVLEELQKGYMINDKVIRYSKVKVSHK